MEKEKKINPRVFDKSTNVGLFFFLLLAGTYILWPEIVQLFETWGPVWGTAIIASVCILGIYLAWRFKPDYVILVKQMLTDPNTPGHKGLIALILIILSPLIIWLFTQTSIQTINFLLTLQGKAISTVVGIGVAFSQGYLAREYSITENPVFLGLSVLLLIVLVFYNLLSMPILYNLFLTSFDAVQLIIYFVILMVILAVYSLQPESKRWVRTTYWVITLGYNAILSGCYVYSLISSL